MLAMIDRQAMSMHDVVLRFQRAWGGALEWLEPGKVFRLGKTPYRIKRVRQYDRPSEWRITELEPKGPQ